MPDRITNVAVPASRGNMTDVIGALVRHQPFCGCCLVFGVSASGSTPPLGRWVLGRWVLGRWVLGRWVLGRWVLPSFPVIPFFVLTRPGLVFSFGRSQMASYTQKNKGTADVGRCLAFCNTKAEVDDISRAVGGGVAGVRAEGLHGDMSQHQRERVLQRFRTGASLALCPAS